MQTEARTSHRNVDESMVSRRSGIREALDNLTATVEMMREVAQKMAVALESVLRPNQTVHNGIADRPKDSCQTCKLQAEINACFQTAHEAKSVLVDVLDRLEL